jgi:hypothetical protein
MGSVTLDSDQSVQGFTLTGGVFTGLGTLTVTDSTNMSGGYMTGAGTTRAEGGLLLNGTHKYFQDSRRLVNASGQHGEWAEGNIYLYDTAALVNEAGATFEISGASRSATGVGVDGVIDNHGLLTVGLDAISEIVTITSVFNNSGDVDVDTGVLRLSGGGSHTGDFTSTENGELNIGGGDHIFTAGSRITADQVVFSQQYAGTYEIDGSYGAGNTTVSGNTVNFNVDADTGTLTQTGGEISGAGTLTVSGQTTMSGGSMTGAGTTQAEGGLLLNGTNKFLEDSRRLVNASGQHGEWSQGNIYLYDTATLVNEAGATFEISGASRSASSEYGVDSAFDNQGSVVVNTSDTDQVISVSTLNNTGSIDIRQGTLHSTDSNHINDGNIRVASGATLSGNYSLQNSATGLITGSGLIDPGSSYTYAFTNAGQISPGDGIGTLSVDGDLAMLTSSIFNVDLGGLSDFDLLSVTGDSALSGTVNVSLVNGFIPTVGQTFDILLTEALTGEFSSIVSANSDYQWSMTYILNEAGQDIARLGVSAVPLPAAAWLLLSGIAVLAGFGRRRSIGQA